MAVTAIDRLADIMERIGQHADLGVVLRDEGGRSWSVCVDEREVFIMLDLDEDRAVAVFSAEIGTPRPALAAEVNALALGYGHLWRETGGIHITLNRADGTLHLIAERALETITLDTLGPLLRRITGIVAGWREIVDKGPAAGAAGDTGLPDDLQFAIRI